GLYSHSTSVDSTPWQPVLQPCHGVGATADCSDVNSNYRDIANDVVVDPSNAQHLLANVAWLSGAAYNGFYERRNGGTTCAKIDPTGSLSPKDVGNTTFGYAADGSKLYAAVESPQALNSGQSSA